MGRPHTTQQGHCVWTALRAAARDGVAATGSGRSLARRVATALAGLHPLAATARSAHLEADQARPSWQVRPETMSASTWRAAKLISLLANPMVLCPICSLAVAHKAATRWPERLTWWGLSCGLLTLVPVIHIRWGVKTGRLSDSEISVRHERFLPYLAQIASVGVTYALLRRLQAPRLVVALVISVAGGMVVITGVTTVWKMSMHLTGAAGTATVVVLIYGKRALPLVGLLPVVAWSRYVLDHHTPAQAVAGAVLGAAAPLVVFRKMDLS